ncbi:MAG: LysM domain-containing protein [Firmicutes bacterium]|nr:LysM domain-containing protein [Bacillota bacterium]
MIYKTVQGDTFDKIALEFYNDEFKAHLIMQANLDYLDYIILPQGVELNIPEVKESQASTLPPWMR